MPAPVRLLHVPPSPFARKCRVVIHERGIEGIEEVAVDVLAAPKEVLGANPLGQIPALEFDDGSALFDSPVICAFLETMGRGAHLTRHDDFPLLRRQALGDGIGELAVKLRYDQIRPQGEQSPTVQARWRASILRGLDVAEAEGGPEERFDIGDVALVCVLGYIDYRHGDLGWREGRPYLTALVERLGRRPSFIATKA